MKRTTSLSRLIIIFLLFSSGPVWAQSRQQLTVERLFALPSLSGVAVSTVSWSPTGKLVAYLRSDAEGGAHEVWLYDAIAKRAARFLGADELFAGEEHVSPEEQMLRERTRSTRSGISNYFWAPDGKSIFVPYSGDLFRVEVSTKRVERILDTPSAEFDPKISPDGTRVAFIREGEVFVKELATGMETRLTSDATNKIKNGISEFVAQEEMDRHTGYWWSPDSKRIAYLQIDNTPVKEFLIPNFLTDYTDVQKQEYPKAGTANTVVRVGVVGVEGSTTTWMRLGSNPDVYVPRVQWLPNGNTLAVQVQSRNQDTIDVLLCDPATGTARLLLRETDPRWVSLHDGLYFFKDGERFLWLSERDGFRHLYLYTIKREGVAEPVRQITRGRWDIESVVGVDERRELVYFTAYEKSSLEIHFYSIRLDGSSFKRLSTSDGFRSIAMAPDAQHYVEQYSTVMRPPLLAHMTVSKSTAAMIEENRVPHLDDFDLPQPQFITIPSADGSVQLHAFIITPPLIDGSRRYPAVVYQYNGPTAQVVVNRWGGVRMLWHRALAAKGYVVFAVDGRGTPGRGRAFQNLIHKRLGEVELQDQLAGAAYLKALPYVDSTRVMIWGKSYGGFMTCMAMFRTNAFKLGIAVAPVTDWKNYDTHYTERYLELPYENSEGYRLSSPLTYAGGLNGKLLLIHGVVDDNVHFQDSMLLVDALQKANKQFDFMAYPRSTHSFAGSVVGTHWYSLMTRYIQDHL
ncbi:MAG: S9 family peptidase [Ignavibacteria bacterium]